jgi:8-oxo-dGTP pyrophosphatase MutT (NUDIX family)
MLRIGAVTKICAFITAVIIEIIIAVSPVCAEGPAGMVLYCCQGQDVFLLLADHADGTRGWGSFGGSALAGETQRDTAARETEEETRRYFSRTWLRGQIAAQLPFMTNGFATYFVAVPFVPAQRIMNNPTDEMDKSATERGCYAWIPFPEIERILLMGKPSSADLQINPEYLPRGCKSVSYWDVWIESMRDAMMRNAFPWGQGRDRVAREW